MTDTDKPLPSLDELQRQIDKVKPEGENAPENGPTPASSYSEGMRMGTDLLAGVGVGGVLGYFVDKWADTAPVFLILFFICGFAAGVRNILRNSDKV